MSAKRIHRVIAEQVKEQRNKRGISAARLAEKLNEIGIPWDRSIVANFESGRRASVSVEELVALGYVLAVPPALLMFPLGTEDEVRLVQDVEVHPLLALKFFEGHETPFAGDAFVLADRVESWVANALPLSLYRQLDRARDSVEQSRNRVRTREERARYVDFDEDATQEVRSARRDHHEAVDYLDGVLVRMHAAGVKSPTLSVEDREDLERFGYEIPESVRFDLVMDDDVINRKETDRG